MKHDLIPPHLQLQLVAAAATKDMQVIDAVIDSAKRQAPYKFHTEETLKKRVFFNQPRGQFSGSFIKLALS